MLMHRNKPLLNTLVYSSLWRTCKRKAGQRREEKYKFYGKARSIASIFSSVDRGAHQSDPMFEAEIK